MKKAFTLAEVLAALAIVGVIASVSIPTLQAGYMDRKYKSLAKKAHLTLQQGIEATMLEENVAKARVGMGLIYWLAADSYKIDGYTYKKEEPSLRTIATNEFNNNKARVKMTDGMIIEDSNTCNSCAGSSVCTIYVDVDGAGGPTKSGIGTKLSSYAKSATAVDIMMFQCRNNMVMPPLSTQNSEAANRTRAHLGIQKYD